MPAGVIREKENAMKKSFLVLAAASVMLVSCMSMLYQSNPVWEETVEVKGASADDLYRRIHIWACNGYRHPNLVPVISRTIKKDSDGKITDENTIKFAHEYDIAPKYEDDIMFLPKRIYSTVSVLVNDGSYTVKFAFNKKREQGVDYNFPDIFPEDFRVIKAVWKDYAAGLKSYVAQQPKTPPNTAELVQSGYTELNKLNYISANNYFAAALFLDPFNIEALDGFAVCQFNASNRYGFDNWLGGYFSEAGYLYDAILRLDPDDTLSSDNKKICAEARKSQLAVWSEMYAGGMTISQRNQQTTAYMQGESQKSFQKAAENLNMLATMYSQQAYGAAGGYSGGQGQAVSSSSGGGSLSSDSGESQSSGGGRTTCSGCGGAKKCTAPGCDRGKVKSSSYYTDGSTIISNCGTCRGSGKCGVCYGRGYIR